MRKLLIFSLLGFILLLSACGNQEESSPSHQDEHEQDASLTPVKVEILVEDELKLGEVQLKAKVTHGEAPVKKAEEVMFEVWLEGKEDQSTEVMANHSEDGTYVADFTFEKPGTYYMYAHVTAKQQHVMPKHEFKVVE